MKLSRCYFSSLAIVLYALTELTAQTVNRPNALEMHVTSSTPAEFHWEVPAIPVTVSTASGLSVCLKADLTDYVDGETLSQKDVLTVIASIVRLKVVAPGQTLPSDPEYERVDLSSRLTQRSAPDAGKTISCIQLTACELWNENIPFQFAEAPRPIIRQISIIAQLKVPHRKELLLESTLTAVGREIKTKDDTFKMDNLNLFTLNVDASLPPTAFMPSFPEKDLLYDTQIQYVYPVIDPTTTRPMANGQLSCSVTKAASPAVPVGYIYEYSKKVVTDAAFVPFDVVMLPTPPVVTTAKPDVVVTTAKPGVVTTAKPGVVTTVKPSVIVTTAKPGDKVTTNKAITPAPATTSSAYGGINLFSSITFVGLLGSVINAM